jgi:hypothetical protein
MTHDEIKRIPKNQTVTFACVVVHFCPLKVDPHQICITAGGTLINYPGKLSMWTANIIPSKLMWNSVLSTESAKYMCLNIKNLFLTAPLDRFKYMKMPIALFQDWSVKQYHAGPYGVDLHVM